MVSFVSLNRATSSANLKVVMCSQSTVNLSEMSAFSEIYFMGN